MKKTAKRTRAKVPRIKKKKGQLRLKGISGIPVIPSDVDIKIAEGIAKGMKKFEALVSAGISESNARSNSAEILTRPGVLAAQAIVLEKANVNMERIAQVLDEGLNARKIISANLLVLAGAEPGGIVDAPEDEGEASKILMRVPDYPTRRGYLETAIDVMERVGTMPQKPKDNGPGGPEMSPVEEKNLIENAEKTVGSRDISRYTVIHERA